MDQETRNKLQRATQQVRRILEEEFAEQLEGTFDILPSGVILPEPGKHLDAGHRLTRQKLVPYAKGGDFSTFFYDNNLLLDWHPNGQHLKAFIESTYGGSPSRFIANASFFTRPGLTYPRKTVKGFNLRALPAGQVFDAMAISVFPKRVEDLVPLLGLLNSSFANYSLVAQTSSRQWEKGMLASMPIQESLLNSEDFTALSAECVRIKQQIAESDETSHLFWLKRLDVSQLRCDRAAKLSRLDELVANLDQQVLRAYGISKEDIGTIDGAEADTVTGTAPFDRKVAAESPAYNFIADSISNLIGVAFGRWDIRYTMGDRTAPELPDPFASLPFCPPGQLQNTQGLPSRPEDVPDTYPVRILWDGIAVDDPNHLLDIEHRVREINEIIWRGEASAPKTSGPTAETIEQDACDFLGVESLRDYFRKPGGFFAYHLKRYSKSRRKAPIYWQLATPSTSYAVWLYYHRFTKDTFFKVLNEFVQPKLDDERQKLDRLRGEAGAEPTRSQRKGVEDQERFVAELTSMARDIERIAPLWNPDLNDGVIINFAPLWRLVPQNKSWQKECKSCWDKLVKGDYDWAHLAMHLWPERVVPKCVTDASLAIAHGLEDVFWIQDDKDRFQPKEEPDGGWQAVIDRLVAERTSAAVKAALKSLLEAPAPAGKTKRKSRKTRGGT